MSSRKQDVKIEVVASNFGKFQREIAAAETKIMQLRVSLKHKSDAHDKLIDEHSQLKEVLSKQEVVLKSLRDEISHEKISKTNIQLDLRNKEECAQELRKNHRAKMEAHHKELVNCLATRSAMRAKISKHLALIDSE